MVAAVHMNLVVLVEVDMKLVAVVAAARTGLAVVVVDRGVVVDKEVVVDMAVVVNTDFDNA